MNKLNTALVVGAATIGTALGGFGIAAATSGSSTPAWQTGDDDVNEAVDSDAPLRGTDLDRAVAVALEHIGGGEVTETEVGDDGAAYGVEIRQADGTQVEVNLNDSFDVIGSTADED